MAKKKPEDSSFEYSFVKLKQIMEKLEHEAEDSSLDEIISQYQEGLQLLTVCRKKLKEAEIKIEKINSDLRSEEKNNL
ncbi:hypothetical protein BH10BAC5_BH10BAC5_24630 [soil metagenome]